MTTELAGQLARRLGAREIRGLRQLSGGASRETWEFEASLAAGPRQLVLRRDPPGAARPEAMAREAEVLRAAAEEGVPVPPLIDHDTSDALGAPFVLTSFVGGETIPRRLLRAVPEGLAAELGRVLARIHRIPPAKVPSLERHDPLATLVATYDSLGEPLPPVEIGLHWLHAHRPPPVPDTVVHGDFRNGNLIVRPAGLAAVLDWERVHRGDPREDLGWLCVKAWRFGSALPVGGFGTLDELLDGYAEVAGERPDPEAVRWWQVFGTVWWAVGCRVQAQRHLAGETRSVELAAVGRRVCEQEHDLLLALGMPAGKVPEEIAEPSELHGHPSAGQLLEAAGEFLRGDVLPATSGRTAFHTRVAANVLDTVWRELRLGPAQERRHRARLAALGFASQAEFASALRDGRADPDDPATLAAVRESVTERLLVANPAYLDQPSGSLFPA
ncbi:phosphotransferase family protein [Amycolatopsis sp. K13G38]|uniref:Phosphotransferase family protein n=1 Tax=Amycolatopsis acididurans TaxID=2724524 RepID=A0ABX1IYV8_9PSEU|nr:phosphotransferase family protein [Amycolatopsis acididurans]NKQ52698.1 phosphotransferase family protein [Amycolatopsis acididurans]